MIRKLTKLGNNSFSITLPKQWVKRYNLLPRSDLEILETGRNLIISSTPIQKDSTPIVVYTDALHEEEVVSKITGLYRAGYKEVKLITKNKVNGILEDASKYASNLHGVTIENCDDAILMKSSEENQKRADVLQKSFHNILWLSELVAGNPLEIGWKKQVYDTYHRIYFLSEYSFRLISIEGESDFRLALNQFAISWTIQCLAEILKRIAEIEHNNAMNKLKGVAACDMQNMIKAVYNVCVMRKDSVDFYVAKKNVETNLTENKYDNVTGEYIHMCQYLCTKLIRQEIVSDNNSFMK